MTCKACMACMACQQRLRGSALHTLAQLSWHSLSFTAIHYNSLLFSFYEELCTAIRLTNWSALQLSSEAVLILCHARPHFYQYLYKKAMNLSENELQCFVGNELSSDCVERKSRKGFTPFSWTALHCSALLFAVWERSLLCNQSIVWHHMGWSIGTALATSIAWPNMTTWPASFWSYHYDAMPLGL